MEFDTMAVHAARSERAAGSGAPPGPGSPELAPTDRFDDVGTPHVPDIDLSSTYGFRSSADVARSMDDLLSGERSAPNPVYARLYNPTVAGFEDALAALEGAEAAVAFATGMAAITATVMAAVAGTEEVDDLPSAADDLPGPATGLADPTGGAGSGLARGRRPHVVGIRPLYGGTDHLLTSGLLGTRVTWAEASEVEDAIEPETRLVLLETPANPTLAMVDIRDVVARTRRAATRVGHPIAVAVDSTFATPVLQTPITLGADLVVHSATKFLGGHGDVVGGVVATSEAWARSLRRIRMITGGILHPLAGYLLHRGLQTLPVRVRTQQETARILAARLSEHRAVDAVHYPGIARGPSGRPDPTERRLLATQQRGPGSVLSFRVRGGAEGAARVVESVSLITPAVSLGSVDTLIQAPALLTHRVVDPADREASGVPDDLIRLSVGLEAVDDLWADLDAALRQASRSAA